MMCYGLYNTVAQKGQTQTNFRKHKPISENTNQIPKTQIRFRKHKPISKSTNQFRETLTNFQKHKPKSQNTNQNLKTQTKIQERGLGKSLPRSRREGLTCRYT